MDTNEHQAMDVSSTSGPDFPPKWSICVRCKALPKMKNVVSLPCLHICCSKECIDRLLENDGPWSCPDCYQRFNRDMIHSCSYLNANIVMRNLATQKSSDVQICRSCVRDAPAYKWCIDCVEFLCEYCTEHHQFSKMTRDHTLAPTSEGIVELDEELMEGPMDRKCLLHSQEDLSVFCETCKAALCSTCIETTSRHTGHSTIPLESLARTFQDEFYSGVEILKTVQTKAQLAVKALDSKLKNILTEQKTYMHKEARVFFKRLIDALLKREIQLRKDLVEATLSKAKELNIKKAKVSSLVIQCQQYIDSVQDIVEKGSRWTILHEGEHLRSQYNELSRAHAMLTNSDQFDNFVEADYNFVMEERTIKMAEDWIDKICQPMYTRVKPGSEDETTVSPILSVQTNGDIKTQPIPMDIDADLASNGITPRVSIRTKHHNDLLQSKLRSPDRESVQKSNLTPEKSLANTTPTSTTTVTNNDSSSKITGSPIDKKSPRKVGNKVESVPLEEAETQLLEASMEEEVRATRRSVRVPKHFENEETSSPVVKKSSRIASKSTTSSPAPVVVSSPPRATTTTPDVTKSPVGSRRSSSAAGKKQVDSVKPEKTKGSPPTTPRKAESRGTSTDTSRTRRHSGSSETSSSVATRSRERSSKRTKVNDTVPVKVEAKVEAKAKPVAEKKTGEKARKSRGRARLTMKARRSKKAKEPSFLDNVVIDTDDVPGELKEYPILREERMKITMEDENEDYCAVCLDGGDDVLICCDNCPKVFHLKCHVPVIKAVPESDWQCLFCTSYDDILARYPAPEQDESDDNMGQTNVTEREFYIACKFLCELYKVKESLAVRGFYDKMFKQYMNQPAVSLTTMRLRLAMENPTSFPSALELVQTSRKLLYQAKMFYSAISKENKPHLDKFEEKYEEILKTYFPLLTDLRYDPEADTEALPLKFTEHAKGIYEDTPSSSNTKAK